MEHQAGDVEACGWWQHGPHTCLIGFHTCVRKKNICFGTSTEKKAILEGQSAHPSTVCLLPITLQKEAANVATKLLEISS